jgi:hypothetical protein
LSTQQDLVWIGQPNLDRHQTDRLMAAFTCTIHRHNDHTLYRCGKLKHSIKVTYKTDPPPSRGGLGSNRGGSGRCSDDRGKGSRGRGGRGYRNQDSSEPKSAPPTTNTPTKGASGAATQLGSPAQADTVVLPPALTLAPSSPAPPSTITGKASPLT